jgi:hypothetical protein
MTYDIDVRPMNPEDEVYLKNRGEQFRKLCLGANYWEYQGNMCINTVYGYQHFKADGRIMIDSLGFNKMMPSYLSGYKNDSNEMRPITDEN